MSSAHGVSTTRAKREPGRLTVQALDQISRHEPWLANQRAALPTMMRHLETMRCIPGNGGDLSFLVPTEAAKTIESSVSASSVIHVPFESLGRLAKIRKDGRTYYRAEGLLSSSRHLQSLARMAGKFVLATTSAAKLWTLPEHFAAQVCVLRVADDLSGIELYYGPHENGGVPTTELIAHLIMHDANLGAGHNESVVLHAHPQLTIDCSRLYNRRQRSSLLQAFYRQRPELIANVADLIGIVPLLLPGSAELTEWTAKYAKAHRVILWSGHGVIVREIDVERCVDLIDYLEASAGGIFAERMLGCKFTSYRRADVELMVRRFALAPHVLNAF